MNTMTKKLGFICATAVALAFVHSAAVRATEPLDNTPPWGTPSGNYVINTSNVTQYVTNTSNGLGAWGDGADRQIYPHSDVDYAVMQCGKYASMVSQGKIHDVGIGFNTADVTLDLDMDVFDPSGYYLGGSYGVSSPEDLNVSSYGLDSVVVRVYAYSGTGGYSIGVACQ